MKMCHSRWDATLLRGLTVLMRSDGADAHHRSMGADVV